MRQMEENCWTCIEIRKKAWVCEEGWKKVGYVMGMDGPKRLDLLFVGTNQSWACNVEE